MLRRTGRWFSQTPQQVNYPELQSAMQSALVNHAQAKHIRKMEESPTRAVRHRYGWEGMSQTSNEMSVVAIAHRLTEHAISQTFAPGRRDGAPGVTPGWTPYMCRDGWGNEDHIVRCAWYTNRNYPPEKEDWPWGEHFWKNRYSVPNSEATPQQTFRQKIVLYGYLFTLGR